MGILGSGVILRKEEEEEEEEEERTEIFIESLCDLRY